MAGPVVAWSLDDAATACKHEPRIVREHALKADGMARPAPWPWGENNVSYFFLSFFRKKNKTKPRALGSAMIVLD